MQNDKDIILRQLQGDWRRKDVDISFTIRGDNVVNLVGTAIRDTKLFLKWFEPAKTWQITVPEFMWIYAFIAEVTIDSFAVYDYNPMSGKSIQIRPQTFDLLNPDTIYIFNRL